MRIRGFGLVLAILGSCWSAATAQQPAGIEAGKDYAELARLIHKMVGGQFPKVFEQDEGWGQTIPVPGKLRLQGLRTRLVVDGKEVLPHGLWRKVQARLDDPERDLTIRVRSLQPQPDGVYRLTLDVDAALRGEMEMVHWQKGLRLVNLIAEGDALVGMSVACDVKVTLDPKRPLGKVKLAPNVTDLQMSLKDFKLHQVALRRLGPILEGEQARAAGEMLKGVVEKMLQGMGPGMKDRFNEAIARSLADGGGSVPVGELLKALSPRPKKE